MLHLFIKKVPTIELLHNVSSRGYIRGYPLMWRFGDFLDREKVTRRRLDKVSNRCCYPCRASGTEYYLNNINYNLAPKNTKNRKEHA